MFFSHFRKYTAFAAIAVLGFTGCDLAQNHLQIDRAGDKSVQDYRDAFAPRPMGEDDKKNRETSGSIPDFEQYVAQDESDLKPMPIVSVSVNESVQVREILYELAKQSGYGVELDPRINGSIIFTAKNKPLDVVIERIADMAGLRYELRNGVISVRLDTPYTKNYKIDYLNIIRENEGSISTDISLVTTADEGGSDGTETGSQYSIESEGINDFWGELESNITTILRSHARPDLMRTNTSGGQLDLGQIGEGSSEGGQDENGGSGDSGGDSGGDSDGPARLSVDSLSQQQDGQDSSGNAAARYLPQFSINKQAGIISVHASNDVHKVMQEFFTQLKRSVTSQVLIQAKVMQVELSDEFSAGIRWSEVAPLAGEGTLAFQGGGRDNFFLDSATENFVAGVQGDDFEAIAEALSRFGTVNTLASPRVTAINNQPAMLSVAKNEVYFELDVEREEQEAAGGGTGDTIISVDSDVKSVPEGVLINVMPSINLEKREVSMRVRPTITEIVDRVDDPSVALTLAQSGSINQDALQEAESQIPVVDIQEMDTVVNMQSSEAIVIGGLMQDSSESEQTGVPVLSEMPGIGALFRKQVDQIEKKELVIFLRTTILDKPSDSVQQTDKELYREFSKDRRPFDL